MDAVAGKRPLGRNRIPSSTLKASSFKVNLICFPFLKYRPWQLRRTPALLGMEEQLFGLREGCDSPEGPFLRKLWSFARELEAMPKGMVWKVLQSQQPDQISHRRTNKRRGSSLEKNGKRRPILNSKER